MSKFNNNGTEGGAMLSEQQFGLKLNVLTDILIKKKQALMQIANICENQGLLFTQPPSEERTDFMKAISVEKQNLIEVVIECDDVFQTIFNEIHINFEERAKKFHRQTAVLQGKIKDVMELDIKIRAYEEKNKALVNETRGQQIDKNNAYNKNYLSEQYKKNSRPKKDSGEPK